LRNKGLLTYLLTVTASTRIKQLIFYGAENHCNDSKNNNSYLTFIYCW